MLQWKTPELVIDRGMAARYNSINLFLNVNLVKKFIE